MVKLNAELEVEGPITYLCCSIVIYHTDSTDSSKNDNE
jgi:hypothetical protein